MKTLLLVLASITISTAAFAGFGEIQGRVTDADDGLPLPGAFVQLLDGENVISAVASDIDGYYSIKPIQVGTYNIRVSFIGTQVQLHEDIVISDGQQLTIDFAMTVGQEIGPIVINGGPPKGLVTPGTTGMVTVLTATQIETSAAVDAIGAIAAATPGVYQEDDNSPIQVNGGRIGTTAYLVDGVRIMGDPNIIRNSVGQIQVLTGGVPAKYGDFTGGIVVIETKVYRLKMY